MNDTEKHMAARAFARIAKREQPDNPQGYLLEIVSGERAAAGLSASERLVLAEWALVILRGGDRPRRIVTRFRKPR